MSIKAVTYKYGGRPTKYSKSIIGRLISYINNCIQNHELPTKEHFAGTLGVSTRTLYTWEEAHEEFFQAMVKLMDAQKHMVLVGGLEGKYNARITTLLLKAKHDMKEESSNINANQNNFFAGISPELMAEAMKIAEITHKEDS